MALANCAHSRCFWFASAGTSHDFLTAGVQLFHDTYADDEELYKYAVADQIGWNGARSSASAADGWRSSGSWVIPGLSVPGLIEPLSMSLDGQNATRAEYNGQSDRTFKRRSVIAMLQLCASLMVAWTRVKRCKIACVVRSAPL